MKVPTTGVQGYIEGYYGKLLSWCERKEIAQSLALLGHNTYCYAPKEDPQHRLAWRESHSTEWYHSFEDFCNTASGLNISIVAGIAPGLDFQFNNQAGDQAGNLVYNLASKTDFDHLLHKSLQYLEAGATEILVLWDDIDDTFTQDINISEGTAHARAVNQLSAALNRSLWCVPRVYATEIENKNNYLEDFFTELESQHTVLLCGNAIVTSLVSADDIIKLSQSNNHADTANKLKHRTIIWDNFYANDYCPRRLFIGPWTGRAAVSDYLINPTGLPYTDKLILDIVSATHTAENSAAEWRNALTRHGVPDAFLHIADYFESPCFGDRLTPTDSGCPEPTASIEWAIEECLWRWKSPLAREWYPFIMSLKHDLALMQNTLPTDRILKTQTPGLTKRLLNYTRADNSSATK